MYKCYHDVSLFKAACFYKYDNAVLSIFCRLVTRYEVHVVMKMDIVTARPIYLSSHMHYRRITHCSCVVGNRYSYYDNHSSANGPTALDEYHNSCT